MTKIKLCSNPNGCCPVYERRGDVITITDDDGVKITLTAEQCIELIKLFNEGVDF